MVNNTIVSNSCCVEIGETLILDDVSFSVNKNSLIAVVGPNGGGKTTLFNAITGLIPITKGSIEINGQDVSKGNVNIGYVPQNENLNWNFPLTARQVVNLGIIRNSPSIPFISKNNDDLIKECLNDVGLYEQIDNRVDEMSGGQKQRVLLAKILAQGANILLLDEAFSGVDIGSQISLIEVLKKLKDSGKTIMIATHDINNIADRFDEVLCLNRHCCAYGDPLKVFTQDVLSELYGSHGTMFQNHKLGSHGEN
ncbi:MAG: metal ABC transporter ATP-binding protein [SAR202 cluster bacterium]|nr:metal ABC transporter ATP-binding protein [SAR202 cluster bacterium]MQG43114.1 metal ABC transporter ATP-binding protein [SAR202 cluster bacterium]